MKLGAKRTWPGDQEDWDWEGAGRQGWWGIKEQPQPSYVGSGTPPRQRGARQGTVTEDSPHAQGVPHLP